LGGGPPGPPVRLIICHRYKFIFLKTRKTAGTSIEIALSRLCDEGDVVTTLLPDDEALRQSQGGRAGINPQVSQKDFTLRDRLRVWRGRPPRDLFYNHVPANAVRAALPREIWDSYLKISIERNPWDRVLSQYWWDRSGREDYPPFSRWLAKRAKRGAHRISNWNIYAIGNEPVASRLLRYEALDDDLAALGREIGVPDLAMPTVRAKGGVRPDRRDYRDVLSTADANRVADICKREIALLGYEF
jgi:hypothetical protein